MATIDLNPIAIEDGRIMYTPTHSDWEVDKIPDLLHPGGWVDMENREPIDVVILGDGYLTSADFEIYLEQWIDDFTVLPVYAKFAAAFRIRALFTPSDDYVSKDRASYYRTKVKGEGTKYGVDLDDPYWWQESTGDDLHFREKLWESVFLFSPLNTRLYSDTLVFERGVPIGRRLRNLYRNLVVCLLIRTATDTAVSGVNARVYGVDDHASCQVRVAMGADALHEFSHAFAYLSDEYIKQRGSTIEGKHPHRPNVFALSNLSFKQEVSEIPWLHLSPWGRWRRQAAGSQPSPLIGWMWVGGKAKHHGVWHAEYFCRMNGRANNFRFTQVEANDPTSGADHIYDEDTDSGQGLRTTQLCFWCQEIIVIKILEKIDEFVGADDPDDWIERGEVWYERWRKRYRENYYTLFNVKREIERREAFFSALARGGSGELLWLSDLYQVPREDPVRSANRVVVTDDGEWAVILTL